MRKEIKDMLVIGFALFSMYFGAGNVIFPPFLGLQAGSNWISGFISYYIADIGLALLAIYAMLRCNSDIEGVTKRIGKYPALILSSVIVLCIGPLLAIPRTAASVHEMTIIPLLGNNISIVITSVVFFALILIVSINESSVIDIVGKFLTPALFIGLIILIVKGFISPVGEVSNQPYVENIISEGILAGYQTMDVLASLIFGVIIVKNIKDKGYTSRSQQILLTGGSSIVAGIGLLIIYGGLTYLGASASQIFPIDISRSTLIIEIVKMILGEVGTVIFAIVVALACITTAAALVSSTGSYFNKITNGRLSYKAIVIFVCVFSAVVSNFGLDYIISVSAPILNIIYPSAITLIVLTIFGDKINNDNVFKLATLGALIASTLELSEIEFMKSLPFASIGFAWVLPALIFGIIGYFIKIPNKN